MKIYSTVLFLLSFNYFTVAQKFLINKEPDWIIKKNYSDIKINTRQISDGYYLSLYEYQINVEKKQNFTKEIRKIVTSEGVQNGSEITINFDPAYQRLILHTLKITRKGQFINKLFDNTFKVEKNETSESSFIYNGNLKAKAILTDVRIGDEIEYSYSIIGFNPIYGNKYFTDIYLSTESVIGEYYVRLIYNRNRKINYKTYNNAQEPIKTVSDNNLVFVWDIKNLLPSKSFENLPRWSDILPHVQFTEFQGWEEVSKWTSEIENYKQPISKALQNEIEKIKKNAKNNQSLLIQFATRFVQDEIRYTGIESGVYSQKPHDPSSVFIKKYGDCKDKSLLLVTILRKCGLEAYTASIDTYWGKNLKKYLPSPGLFNHMIVYVKMLNKPFFIDPTYSNQGGKIENNFCPNYGFALISKLNMVDLVPFNQQYLRSIDIAENYIIGKIGKTSSLQVKTIYTDNEADDIRSEIASKSHVEIEDSYLEYYQKKYASAGVTLSDSLKIIDDREKNIITVLENYIINDIWEKPDSSNSNFTAFISKSYISEMIPKESDKSRFQPIGLANPKKVTYIVNVQMPEDWNLNEENHLITRKSYVFDFSTWYTVVNKTVHFKLVYQNILDNIENKAISDYITDYNYVNDSSGYEFYWNGNSNTSDNKSGKYNYIFIIFFLISIGVHLFFKSRRQKNT
jgi:transglutaminase-like putative cysteine protease